MRFCPALLIAAAALLAASSSSANNIGIFGKSGRDAEQGTCIQCHLPSDELAPGPRPDVTVDGLGDGLITGGVADLTITITRGDTLAGIPEAACPERCAGFGAAVDVGAGAFVQPPGEQAAGIQPVQINVARDEVAHVAKSPFIDGKVKYRVLLASLAEGDHTLFIAANDVNGQEFTADRVNSISIPFKVTTPTAPPPQEGGCASTHTRSTSVPVAAFALAGLAFLSPRRRRRLLPALAAGLFVVAAGTAHAGDPAAPKPADKANNNMDNCPAAVLGSATAVKDVDGGVEIDVTGNPDAAKQIRARSKLLVDASKATAKVPKHDGKGDGGGRTGRCPIVMFRSSVTVKDIDGGSALIVKADAPSDVAWLREETRARIDDETEATAGHGKMAHCPAALDGAVTTVTDTKDGVVVKITGDAKAIRDRAKDLLAAAAKPDVAAGHGGNGNGGGGYGRCPVIVKDTKLSSKDVDGGVEISVVANAPADVAALQKEAHKRAERLSVPK